MLDSYLQHWFALLTYSNLLVYTICALFMEAFFEWTVLANLSHLNSLATQFVYLSYAGGPLDVSGCWRAALAGGLGFGLERECAHPSHAAFYQDPPQKLQIAKLDPHRRLPKFSLTTVCFRFRSLGKWA